MGKYKIGDKVLIKGKNVLGYVCDDLDSKEGHYIIDCSDFVRSRATKDCVIDVDERDITLAD
jgi:hypothetical protein